MGGSADRVSRRTARHDADHRSGNHTRRADSASHPFGGWAAGAREAGAVYFIDKALATFNAGEKPAYDDGLRDLNRRASERSGVQATFASLPSAQQDEIIRQIEKTPFFQAVRFDTIIGTFAVPDLGGNRNHAGWQMLGMDHQPRFDPPFGYYDASVNRKG